MNIKNIKKMKSGKYQITFDNNDSITTYDEVILKNNILYKKELSTNDLNEINKLNDYYNIYYSVIRYISKKMRSEKEIKEYINKYNLSKSECEKIVNSLKKNGLLNDDRYIKAYISDRFYLSNDGPYKIKRELLLHNMDENMVDDEIDKISHEDLHNKVKKIIQKKIKNSKGSNYIVKQKIYSDLYNIGYSKELIDECFVDDIDDSVSLEKDYNKIYSDICKKEQDIEKVLYKTKQKLYQKGYSIDDVNKLIKKKDIKF